MKQESESAVPPASHVDSEFSLTAPVYHHSRSTLVTPVHGLCSRGLTIILRIQGHRVLYCPLCYVCVTIIYTLHSLLKSYALEGIWMIDFVQTLPIQIEAAWSRKSTGSAVIYLVNRYTFGMSIILSLVPLSSGTASDKTYVSFFVVGHFQGSHTLIKFKL